MNFLHIGSHKHRSCCICRIKVGHKELLILIKSVKEDRSPIIWNICDVFIPNLVNKEQIWSNRISETKKNSNTHHIVEVLFRLLRSLENICYFCDLSHPIVWITGLIICSVNYIISVKIHRIFEPIDR